MHLVTSEQAETTHVNNLLVVGSKRRVCSDWRKHVPNIKSLNTENVSKVHQQHGIPVDREPLLLLIIDKDKQYYTHWRLLPVCEDKRVEDHHNVNQAE